MNDRKALNIVGLVGTGMVGASFAYALMQNGIANELVLIDKDAARAEGEMMDLNHACLSCGRCASSLVTTRTWSMQMWS